jgi:hypothetical protein
MFQDHATVRANHERFLKRVVDTGIVWGIRNGSGFQGCESNDGDCTVLLFWSDAAYARRAARGQYTDCEPAQITLFDFLHRWLPGMARDKCAAGTNYDTNLCGLELDPKELQRELSSLLSAQQRAAFQERLEESE